MEFLAFICTPILEHVTFTKVVKFAGDCFQSKVDKVVLGNRKMREKWTVSPLKDVQVFGHF